MPVRRTLIPAIALLLVVSAGAPAASEEVDWAFSGAAIQGVALAEDGCSMTLIDVEAKGSPEAASIFGLNRSCPGGGGENSLVGRFSDGSLLYMLQDTPATVKVLKPPPLLTLEITFGIYFNGGFGRFEDATGTAEVVLYTAPIGLVVDGPSSLVYDYGTFTGTIEYDNDSDSDSDSDSG